MIREDEQQKEVRVSAEAGPDRTDFSYSVVIPVFNSQAIVAETISRVVEVFEEAGLRYEIVLVNDGSPDRSWSVISEIARTTPHVVALNLLKNYGQHHANLAGFMESTGDYVITMDDDLQNPPDQALLLIDAALAGRHDVVFGEFDRKKATGFRRLGSKMVSSINRRVFGQPDDLAVSNFRVLRRDVVDRICASRTAHPYVTGQALLFSNNPGNVTVRHEARTVGSSNYTLVRILRLVLAILFSYSSFPLRAAAVAGFALAALSFLLGAFYFVHGLLEGSAVPGWTSLIVIVSVFNGFIIAMLSMLGEYVVRTLNAVSVQQSFHVIERVSDGEPPIRAVP
jgi:glycosyltransferase involved in cell wall biosynthesis